jgi:subtilisin family serine protease
LAKAAAPPPVYTHTPEATRAGGSAAVFLARIRQKGVLPVIVGLRTSLRPEDELSAAELGAQSNALRGMQDRVAARVLGAPYAAVKRYTFIPFMAFTIDEGQFQRLLADPEVASIEEDISVVRPFGGGIKDDIAAASADVQEDADAAAKEPGNLSIIHDGDLLKRYGVSGSGQVIAVLDSGVAKTHPMLAGKVVSEACYSTTNAATNQRSFCPGGVAQSTAKGSGVNCPVSIDGCDHGTHVASIAAGANVGSVRGVALGAKIIAIQVLTEQTSAAQCGGPAKTPCLSLVNSDLVLGLQRVYALRKKYKIAAVNISLGDDTVYPRRLRLPVPGRGGRLRATARSRYCARRSGRQ